MRDDANGTLPAIERRTSTACTCYPGCPPHTSPCGVGKRPLRESMRVYDELAPYYYSPSTTSVENRYDGEGWRVYRKEGASTTRTVRDGTGAVARYEGSGASVTWVLRTPGGLLGEIRPSATSGERRRYFVQDLLGSVRAVVAENGTVLEARDYYAWGLQMPGRVYDATGGSGSASEDYTGHELDEVTVLHYAGMRYYDVTGACQAVSQSSAFVDGARLFTVSIPQI
jgi:hypothetical protein